MLTPEVYRIFEDRYCKPRAPLRQAPTRPLGTTAGYIPFRDFRANDDLFTRRYNERFEGAAPAHHTSTIG